MCFLKIYNSWGNCECPPAPKTSKLRSGSATASYLLGRLVDLRLNLQN